jgi:hypothetical protein
LRPEDLYWRVFFMVGSMTFPMVAADIIRQRSDGVCDPSDVDALTGRLVAFITGGLQTPADGSERKPNP